MTESVRKKLKTGRDKADRAERQLTAADDSGMTSTTESDDRLYVKHFQFFNDLFTS